MSSKPTNTCETHKKKYVGYCESCNTDICLLCTSKHENHELLQYNEIQPSDKRVEELKQKFIEYKKQNKLLKEKLKLWVDKVNYYTHKIQGIFDNNEKVYDNILSNYDINNLKYSDIDNINEVLKKGLILGYKNINLDCFSTDDKILEKSEIIVKAIKEMHIEDIFFSLKEQKNNLENLNILKNEEKVKNKKENEDKNNKKEDGEKKVKKVVKKKKSSATKKINTKDKEENKKEIETDKELIKKKYEDFKEINLKSKLFDTDYLINLDKSKSENLNTESLSSLYRTINNGREVNHINLITNNNTNYIITTGFCYINIFDLKGELQRSLKIHDGDITYMIQMKNGDLLTCCVDGTMKIIRLSKNEGFTVIQTIDTTKIKNEKKNGFFSNNQLYVLLQIKLNQNIITVHGRNLLFYRQTNENKDIYELNQILYIDENKKDNDYDIIFKNKNISSLIEINNDNFVGLNNNTILFFELENKENNKYIFKSEIKDICGSGGPNNILYFNDKILIGGGEIIFIVDTVEKKILNQIKINCCSINCININKNNDTLFIGYETKKNEYEISENKIISKENKIEIEEKKLIKNAHVGSISNIISIEDIENKDDKMNVKLKLVSGGHDKNLKYWV